MLKTCILELVKLELLSLILLSNIFRDAFVYLGIENKQCLIITMVKKFLNDKMLSQDEFHPIIYNLMQK